MLRHRLAALAAALAMVWAPGALADFGVNAGSCNAQALLTSTTEVYISGFGGPLAVTLYDNGQTVEVELYTCEQKGNPALYCDLLVWDVAGTPASRLNGAGSAQTRGVTVQPVMYIRALVTVAPGVSNVAALGACSTVGE